MKGLLVATGYLIGLVSPRDQYHAAAVATLSALRRRRVSVHCPLGSALELHRNLLYVKPPRIQMAQKAVGGVLAVYPLATLATPQRADVEAGLAALARYGDQPISLVDATTASMAKREGLGVLTFDVRHYRLLGADVYEG